MLKDSNLSVTRALPASTGTVYSDSINLVASADSVIPAGIVAKITAPALDATALPNTETMGYKLQESADNSSFTDLDMVPLTQTGADAAGDAADEKSVTLPQTVKQYIRLAVTGSATIGDASGENATLHLEF